ncbi:tetratricopeptide repeat protein [Cytophagaceae bacterium AH-315-L13]|nr:tetratricopeptide repeat protein [Cytophagaceae bacterium AH-315-L13]
MRCLLVLVLIVLSFCKGYAQDKRKIDSLPKNNANSLNQLEPQFNSINDKPLLTQIFVLDSLTDSVETYEEYMVLFRLITEKCDILINQECLIPDTIKKVYNNALKYRAHTHFYFGTNNEGFEYFHDLSKSKCIHDIRIQGTIARFLALFYGSTGNKLKAIDWTFNALRLCDAAKDTSMVARLYIEAGHLFKGLGYQDEALKYNLKSLELNKKIGWGIGVASTCIEIGTIYRHENFRKALEYFTRGREEYQKLNHLVGLGVSENNIGGLYEKYSKVDSALSSYRKAVNYAAEAKNNQDLAIYHSVLGRLFNKIGKLDSSIIHYKTALDIAEKVNNNGGRISYRLWLARVYMDYDKQEAEKYAYEALQITKELGNNRSLRGPYQVLYEYSKKYGDYEDALIYYENYITISDSVKNEGVEKNAFRQQTKYDYEKVQIKKEQEEKEQARLLAEKESRRNRLHYSAIFIGILVLFGGIMALGFIKIPPRAAEAIIFISFLILFEFILIVADPYIEEWTGGAPVYQLIFNALIAGCIFPLHSFFERKLKKRLIKTERKKWSKGIKELMIIGMVLTHTAIYSQPDTLNKAVTLNDSEESPANNEQLSSDSGDSSLLFRMTEESKIDSLTHLYQIATHDTTRINILLAMSEEIYLSNPDSDLVISMKIVELVEKNLSEKFVAKSFLNNDLAKVFKKGLASAYNNIGFIYDNQGDIEKALEYYFLSLKIFEEIKNKRGMADSYNNIGYIYQSQGDIEKILEYYFLSLKIREEIKDKYGMAESYNNIAGIYREQGEIDKALKYCFMSLKIEEEIRDKYGIANSYHNIGSVLCEMDSLDEGMRYFELGLQLEKELGYKEGVSATTSIIGDWQLEFGQVEKALESGLEALAVAKQIGYVDCIERAAKLLSDVYKKQNKFENALAMYELEMEMRDSIVNEKNTKATIRQQMKYEHEKEQIIKEQQEIEQARIQAEITSRRDNLQHSAIFIGILILFGGVLMLGFIRIRPKDAEGIVFLSFMILFEFLLVLVDPHIEQYTGGAPAYKLIFNAGLAGLMFPLHQFFEGKLKKRVIKIQRMKLRQRMEQYKKDTENM